MEKIENILEYCKKEKCLLIKIEINNWYSMEELKNFIINFLTKEKITWFSYTPEQEMKQWFKKYEEKIEKELQKYFSFLINDNYKDFDKYDNKINHVIINDIFLEYRFLKNKESFDFKYKIYDNKKEKWKEDYLPKIYKKNEVDYLIIKENNLSNYQKLKLKNHILNKKNNIKIFEDLFEIKKFCEASLFFCGEHNKNGFLFAQMFNINKDLFLDTKNWIGKNFNFSNSGIEWKNSYRVAHTIINGPRLSGKTVLLNNILFKEMNYDIQIINIDFNNYNYWIIEKLIYIGDNRFFNFSLNKKDTLSFVSLTIPFKIHKKIKKWREIIQKKSKIIEEEIINTIKNEFISNSCNFLFNNFFYSTKSMESYKFQDKFKKTWESMYDNWAVIKKSIINNYWFNIDEIMQKLFSSLKKDDILDQEKIFRNTFGENIYNEIIQYMKGGRYFNIFNVNEAVFLEDYDFINLNLKEVINMPDKNLSEKILKYLDSKIYFHLISNFNENKKEKPWNDRVISFAIDLDGESKKYVDKKIIDSLWESINFAAKTGRKYGISLKVVLSDNSFLKKYSYWNQFAIYIDSELNDKKELYGFHFHNEIKGKKHYIENFITPSAKMFCQVEDQNEYIKRRNMEYFLSFIEKNIFKDHEDLDAFYAFWCYQMMYGSKIVSPKIKKEIDNKKKFYEKKYKSDNKSCCLV